MLEYPSAPRNLIVQHVPLNFPGFDLRWDSPATDPENSAWRVIGANVYRSHDDKDSSYTLLNQIPLGVNFYRDQPTIIEVTETVPSSQILELKPSGDFCIKTLQKPIIKQSLPLRLARDPRDVRVVDTSNVEYVVRRVYPRSGDIQLVKGKVIDPQTGAIVDLPDPGSVTSLDITYHAILNEVGFREDEMANRVFYKITTVAENVQTLQTVETPLNKVRGVCTFDNEQMDYIWREATSRNYWILEQGGERAYIYLRKWFGTRCPECAKEITSDTLFHPRVDCLSCYGTGYLGGYDGPYEIILAPPDSEKMIEITDVGMRNNYDISTWTTYSPVITTRDLVVRRNGDRFEVGNVTPYFGRGILLQQHFTIQQLDRTSIQFQVGLATAGKIRFQELYQLPVNVSPDVEPLSTNHSDIPASEIQRGRTWTYNVITY